MSIITPKLKEKYESMGYRVVGDHSAVSICRWTKSALRGQRHCYKKYFGIDSSRCVQGTPSIQFCNLTCSFCWRHHEPDRYKTNGKWNKPKEIIDGMIESQRKLLSGFGGSPKTSRERWEKANKPRHFAISLDGEVTLYPYLVDMVKELKDRGITSFIVTNGTIPSRLKEMLDKEMQPTSLYISVYGTNKEMWQKATNSLSKELFNNVIESLKLMKQFSCRTIFRITAVKDITLLDPKGYSDLVKIAEPMFVEIKGFSEIGESKKRLTKDHMPNMKELEDFAREIEKNTSYKEKTRDEISRVILLAKDDEVWRRNIEMIKEQNELAREKGLL